MKMKSAILVFLYAARSQAERILPLCGDAGHLPSCTTTGQMALSTALGLGRATSTGDLISEATTSPQTIGNRFTFPDGNEIFNINSTVTALWVTDKPDCSIQLNCTLDATAEPFTSPGTKLDQLDHAPAQNGHTIGGLQFRLPSKSANCTLSMLVTKGNRLAKTSFTVRDTVGAVKSSATMGDLPTTLPISDTAISLSSTFTSTANSNANLAASLTASSANSTPTSALSALSASVPSTTASSIMSSTIHTATAAEASKSGSDPNARLQAVIGILAGAAALLLLQWPS